jgi:hypothetical protein
MYDGLSWVRHYNSFLALNKRGTSMMSGERREERLLKINNEEDPWNNAKQ